MRRLALTGLLNLGPVTTAGLARPPALRLPRESVGGPDPALIRERRAVQGCCPVPCPVPLTSLSLPASSPLPNGTLEVPSASSGAALTASFPPSSVA